MAEHIIEIEEKCRACEGTGVYVGMAELEGASVVCYKCKGTGKYHFKHTYEDFEGRKVKEDVTHIYETNPGLGISPFVTQGGVPYKEWLKTGKFPPKSEMREWTCPAWWYQSADYNKKPDWDWCRGFGGFQGCKHFPNKQRCWDRWDKEYSTT